LCYPDRVNYLSPAFVALVAVSAAVYWAVPPRARSWVLLGVSLGFCFSQAPLFSALYLAFGLGAFALGRYLSSERPRTWRRGLLIAGLAVVIGDLIVWKAALPAGAGDVARETSPGLADLVVPVGLSYLSFRLIHYLVERYRGGLDDRGLVDFLGWLFFFPVLLAGPLLRIGEWRVERPRLIEINRALLRVGVGVVKKAVIADSLGVWLQPALADPAGHSQGMVLLAIYGVALQLYLDFSGYSDVAIGLGRLFGVTVPENFDSPLTKPNIAEFWRSWHITLYTWIRDYVFFPLFGFRSSPWKMYLGAGLSIFIFQIWHAFSANFILLGLFHGGGVIGWHLLQRAKRRWRWLRRLIDRRALRPAWIALTVSWYAVGNVLFMTTPRDFVAVLSRLIS